MPGRYWYDATVAEKLYVGRTLALKVMFTGLPDSHAKIVTAKQKAVRVRIPGTWRARRFLGLDAGDGGELCTCSRARARHRVVTS